MLSRRVRAAFLRNSLRKTAECPQGLVVIDRARYRFFDSPGRFRLREGRSARARGDGRNGLSANVTKVAGIGVSETPRIRLPQRRAHDAAARRRRPERQSVDLPGLRGSVLRDLFQGGPDPLSLQVSPAPVTPTFTDVDPSRISPPGHRGARLFRPHGRLQPPAVLPDRQLPAPAWRSSWSKTPGPPIPEFGLLFVLVVPSSAAAFGRPSCLRTSGSRARRPFGPSSRRVRPSRKDCLEPRKVSPERAPAAGRESGLESAEGRVWCN